MAICDNVGSDRVVRYDDEEVGLRVENEVDS